MFGFAVFGFLVTNAKYDDSFFTYKDSQTNDKIAIRFEEQFTSQFNGRFLQRLCLLRKAAITFRSALHKSKLLQRALRQIVIFEPLWHIIIRLKRDSAKPRHRMS